MTDQSFVARPKYSRRLYETEEFLDNVELTRSEKIALCHRLAVSVGYHLVSNFAVPIAPRAKRGKNNTSSSPKGKWGPDVKKIQGLIKTKNLAIKQAAEGGLLESTHPLINERDQLFRDLAKAKGQTDPETASKKPSKGKGEAAFAASS